MLGSLLACSLEALVIDNDMLGSINRTVRGIEVSEESLSLEVIRQVVHGPGHFLGSPQTLALMQKEYLYPEIGDRDTPDNWLDAGGKDALQVAHEYAREILANHHPDHLEPSREQAIRERFPLVLHTGAR
jgi:trimethylamine--corrinoid protein Co-methyltransferase